MIESRKDGEKVWEWQREEGEEMGRKKGKRNKTMREREKRERC